MVGLLALIAVLVILIGAAKKCQKKQVDEPEERADIEQKAYGTVPTSTQPNLRTSNPAEYDAHQAYQQRAQRPDLADEAILAYEFGFASSPPSLVGPGGRAHCARHLHSGYNPRCEECQKALT